MTKKDIRLEYSGFIIFATKVLSVGTGLIFQLIVARATSTSEYDVWFNINDLMVYFTLLSGVLPFWAMRFVARDKEGAVKTGVLSNLLISIIAMLVYIPLIPVIMSSLHINANFTLAYLLVALQIIEVHSLGMLENCLQARIPHVIGYGLLVQQFSKVILGYVVIIQLQQPLVGAVLATIIAFCIQIAYYLKLLAAEFKRKVQWKYVGEWLKGSVANIYNVVGNQIATSVFIMLYAFGGEGARGTYGAAAQIANVITYSSFLAFALYPKILAERRSEDVTTSLKMVLMFAVPMTIGAVVMSDSFITILKPEQAGAGLVLTVLAIDSLVIVVSGLFSSALYGMETVDEKGRISFRELARSKLFVAFSLPYIHSAITIPTTFYTLTVFAQNLPYQAALYVSIINAVARFLMFLVLYVLVRKIIRIEIPWKTIAKYILASSLMSAFLFVAPHTIRLSLTLVETAVGGLIYILTLMAIDKDARRLPRTVLREILSKLMRAWRSIRGWMRKATADCSV